MHTTNDIWTALKEVMDPEIPTVSLVDLGVITHVEITPEGCSAGQNDANVLRMPSYALHAESGAGATGRTWTSVA